MEDVGSIPGWGVRSHMLRTTKPTCVNYWAWTPQLESPYAATNTWCSQIDKYLKKKKLVSLSLLPYKQAAASMASAQNKARSCLSAQEPAPDKQRTVNVRIWQSAKTVNPQPQN